MEQPVGNPHFSLEVDGPTKAVQHVTTIKVRVHRGHEKCPCCNSMAPPKGDVMFFTEERPSEGLNMPLCWGCAEAMRDKLSTALDQREEWENAKRVLARVL